MGFDGLPGLEVAATGATAEVQDGKVLGYEGLVAWDATGALLPAEMVPVADGVALVVDDEEAVYPVVVDPVLSVTQTQSVGGLGAFSGAGDLNADGFADIVALDTTTGRVNWWLGSSSGVAAGASGSVVTSLPGAVSIDGLGDFNGDGFDDLAVGDPTYNSSRGAVYVFYGRVSGVRPLYGRRIPGAGAGVGVGASVGGVGDTNGDGPADVGAWTNTMTTRVWQGRPNGVALPAPITIPNGYDASYDDEAVAGNISGIGDVNGDGYDDVGVGYPSGDRYLGSSVWVLGSASGVGTTAAGGFGGTDTHTIEPWCGESYSGGTGMGADVAALGDLDADGYDDFALSQSYEACIGYDYAGYGSASGVSTSLSGWPSFYGSGYARSIGAGDFNGDGWGDIAGGYTQLGVATGSASRFSGTTTYTTVASTWTAYQLDTVGDTNGDGCDDLLVSVGGTSLQLYEGCPSGYAEEVEIGVDPTE